MSLIQRIRTPVIADALGAGLVVLLGLVSLLSSAVNGLGLASALDQVSFPLLLGLSYAAGRVLGHGIWVVGLASIAALVLGLVLVGGLGYPNAASAVVVQVLAMIALGWRTVGHPGIDRRLLLAAGAAGLALLVWLGSTAGFVTGLAVLVASALFIAPRHVKVVIRSTGLVVFVAGIVQLTMAWLGGNDVAAWALSNRRLSLWSDAFELLLARPLLGNGPSSFSTLSMTAQDPDTRLAHSVLMEAGAELGLLGIIALGCLVAWGYWRLAVSSTGGYLIGVAAWSALWLHGLVDYVTHFPLVMASAGLVLGASVTLGPATTASVQGADFRRTGSS